VGGPVHQSNNVGGPVQQSNNVGGPVQQSNNGAGLVLVNRTDHMISYMQQITKTLKMVN
jgi:hypothetical protein